jgi:hypothetical protein
LRMSNDNFLSKKILKISSPPPKPLKQFWYHVVKIWKIVRPKNKSSNLVCKILLLKFSELVSNPWSFLVWNLTPCCTMHRGIIKLWAGRVLIHDSQRNLIMKFLYMWFFTWLFL